MRRAWCIVVGCVIGMSGFIGFAQADQGKDAPQRSPAAARRLQEPVKPYPYDEEEVIYENPAGKVTLAGTLTLPRSKGPHPAVLLITGSGAQDRNETIGPLRPFLVLADYLTRRGVAVLRMDDRGTGGSTGNAMESSYEDFVSDIVVGVNYLKSRKEIDPQRIGLMGHSEGGVIGPMVAVRIPDIAFVIMLSSPGVPNERIIWNQNESILRKESEEKRAKEMAGVRKFIDAVKAEGTPEEVQRKLREFVSSKDPRPADQEIENEVRSLSSKWIHDYVAGNVQPFLKQLRCPVLALTGDKDSLVPSKWNLAGIEESLKAAGNKDYTIREMPNVNHFLQPSETESLEEGFKLPVDVSPELMQIVGDWIQARMAPKTASR